MIDVIDYARSCVKCGDKFYVGLQNRSLAINGHYLIKDGQVTESDMILSKWHKEDWPEKKLFYVLEYKYNFYKHSVPSERSESHRRSYFKALPEKDLADIDMMYGQSREFARYELESFLLAMIMCGAFEWKNEWGSWFWQSQNDKDFVILRKWIEPKQDGD